METDNFAVDSVVEDSLLEDSAAVDTMLHFFNYGEGIDLTKVELPLYYRETFFCEEYSSFQEKMGSYGHDGIPLPYSVRTDSIITTIVIICFSLLIIAISKSSSFLLRQLKSLVMVSVNENSYVTETSTEVKFQLAIVIVACIIISLIQYLYVVRDIQTIFILPTQYHLMMVYFLVILCYFVAKAGLYSIVNNVFFTRKRNLQWLKSLLFLTSIEAVSLFPAVLLQTYFEWPAENVIIYISIVILLVKILAFYKCFIIFFRNVRFFIQIILYFCALEIVPLTILWLSLLLAGDILKIQF